MSPDEITRLCVVDRFPRVSGDEPYDPMRAFADIAFSPRERG